MTSDAARRGARPLHCDIPCDDDCDAYCHATHHVPYKREHQPENCPSLQPGRRAELVKPAVLGAFDGVVTVLGILFALAAAPHELRQSVLGLAAAGAVSMGGAQFLADNEAGWWASAAMGLTTGLGTLAPAAPYFVWRGGGGVPAVVSALLCVAAAGVVSWLKTTDGHSLGWRRAAAQTYSLMLVSGAVTLLCAWATGAVG